MSVSHVVVVLGFVAESAVCRALLFVECRGELTGNHDAVSAEPSIVAICRTFWFDVLV
jgi:hypothetical protein